MFSVQNKDIKRLERDLKTFADRALPFATRNTLNNAAFAAQKIARADIKRDFVNRNKFTVQSIRVEMARGLNIRAQKSEIGSIADYMETQEFGGQKRGKKEGVAITTSFAAGQGIGNKNRTRLATRRNKLENIRLRKTVRGKNRKQTNLLKVREAVKTGRREVFLDFGGGRRKGIFRVVGGRKNSQRGWPKGAKIRMLHDMTNKVVTIKKSPWLKPSFDEAQRMIPAFYADALRFQLRRRGLFK